MNEQRMNGLLPDPLQIFPRGTEWHALMPRECLKAQYISNLLLTNTRKI